MLFVPGHRHDWMLKAPKYGADALLFDLEDSVPIAEKSAARSAVKDVISEFSGEAFGRFVRINGWRTGCLLDDLNATVVGGLGGVMLSKTEGPEDVAALDAVLGELERSRGLPLGQIEICPYTECASSIYNFYEVCMASSRIKRAGGTGGPVPAGDSARSLGLNYEEGATEALFFGAYSALQARAAGIVHVEGAMTTKLDDLDWVRRISEKSKRLGASWASAIHPSHIPIINEVYSPSQAEIDDARELVLALAEGIAKGEAAVRYKSGLVDYAHIRSAMNLLKKAQAAGMDVGALPDFEVPAY
nr:CoA ester lyase [Bradyrhizobium sp. 193]